MYLEKKRRKKTDVFKSPYDVQEELTLPSTEPQYDSLLTNLLVFQSETPICKIPEKIQKMNFRLNFSP